MLGFATGTALGFPLVVIVLAVPGLVLCVVVISLAIPAHAAASEIGAPGLRAFLADARELLRIRTLRWVIVSTTVMSFAAGGFNAWLQAFLVRDKGMSKEQATSLLALALCRRAVGDPRRRTDRRTGSARAWRRAGCGRSSRR